MILNKVKSKDVSEAKNLIERQHQQAFVRYKSMKEKKHGKIFSEIDPTEVTLLYWIKEFNFWLSETITVGVRDGSVYSTSWFKKKVEKVEEWGLKGFRNNTQIGDKVRGKDPIILQTDDFDKIINTVESLFCFLYV